MTEWQPIETAPVDNSPVLLWDRERYVVGRHAAHYTLNAWVVGYDEGGAILADNPTHWHPLPDPPK
jgi:hypothetical protein